MTLKSKKTKFYNHKSPVFNKDVGIEKVLVSNKISCTIKNYKHFISYLHDNYKIKQLHIMLPKTSAYLKSCDRQTKWMYFVIEGDDLLEKYNTIWDKVSADLKKEFNKK